MLKAMTPKELAAGWGITETEVMQKINNTLQQNSEDAADRLPDSFIIHKYTDTYRIIVPDGYKFKPLRGDNVLENKL